MRDLCKKSGVNVSIKHRREGTHTCAGEKSGQQCKYYDACNTFNSKQGEYDDCVCSAAEDDEVEDAEFPRHHVEDNSSWDGGRIDYSELKIGASVSRRQFAHRASAHRVESDRVWDAVRATENLHVEDYQGSRKVRLPVIHVSDKLTRIEGAS